MLANTQEQSPWCLSRIYSIVNIFDINCKHIVLADLTHWGRVTHICVGNLTIIGSDNGLSPGRRQAIIWTSAGVLLIGPLGTNFSEILIGIQTFSFKKMPLKMSSTKWRPFCLGLNVLISWCIFCTLYGQTVERWQVSPINCKWSVDPGKPRPHISQRCCNW